MMACVNASNQVRTLAVVEVVLVVGVCAWEGLYSKQ